MHYDAIFHHIDGIPAIPYIIVTTIVMQSQLKMLTIDVSTLIILILREFHYIYKQTTPVTVWLLYLLGAYGMKNTRQTRSIQLQ